MVEITVDQPINVQWLEVTANTTVSSIGNVKKAAYQCKRLML